MDKKIFRPVLTGEALEQCIDKHPTRALIKHRITRPLHGVTEDDQTIFKYVPAAYSPEFAQLGYDNFTGIGHPCKSNHYRNAIRGQEGLYAEWGFKIGIDGQPGLSPITLEHYQNFENALPFVLKLAERYALEMPVEYVTQLAMADKVSDFVIPRTPFSTVYTLTAPTRCHRDGGNLQGVAQVLTPLGRFTGGDFILPRFGVAITMRPGDLLFTDGQKEIHGNIPNIKGDRICVICYLHESLLEQ